MRGNLTRRGKASWRIKFDQGRDPATGKRRSKFVTFRGTKREAEKELTRLLAGADQGAFVDPSKVTVADYLRRWIDDAETTALSPKTAERYRGLIEKQIVPFLGAERLQALKPAQVQQWHAELLRKGSAKGGPLTARTVGHAHRVLHRALKQAAAAEMVPRNVASVVSPPAVEDTELEILSAAQVTEVLAKLEGSVMAPLATVALGTGMRRGELLALRWSDVDLDGGKLRVERALEQTVRGGLRFKAPKTRRGRRTIALPSSAVAVLRDHRRVQLEQRLALGQGKQPPEALVFSTLEGEPRSPRATSKEWARLVVTRKMPAVTFHALRHTHVSALIAAGVDVLTISRRIGHASPAITLGIYGHLFSDTDDKAASAINAALSVPVGQ